MGQVNRSTGVGKGGHSVALAGAVALLLALAACSSGQGQNRPKTAPPAVAGVAPDGHDWCSARQVEPVECVVEGNELVGIVYQGAPESSDLVLWDPGGPGLGLPPEGTPMQEALPASLQSRNVVLVTEPWQRVGVPADCTREADDLPASCPLGELATTDSALVRSVHAVEEYVGGTVTGLYLQSFGAPRSFGALVARPGAAPLGWVVLDSPAPLVGSSAVAMVKAREAGARNLLRDACTSQSCTVGFEENLERVLSRNGPGHELAWGLLALAGMPQGNAEMIALTVEQITSGDLAPEIASRVKRLGRAYAGQRMDGRTSDQTVGFWADTCPRYKDWDSVHALQGRWGQALAWIFRACSGDGDQVTQPDLVKTTTPILIVSSKGDAVVPVALQRPWGSLPSARFITSTGFHGAHPHLVNTDIEEWISARD